MKNVRDKNYTIAMILILIAGYMIVSKLDIIPRIPIFPILFTLVFAYAAIRSLMRLHFFEGMISLAIIGCINDKLLGIEAITPVTLIMAFCMIGIALDMIFRHRRCGNMRIEDGSCTYGEIVDNNVDGERVCVKNSFGTTSKYINSNGLKEAKIDNCFGECKVYFNNVVLENDHAYIRVDNSFGSTNIYLPATWRINVSQDTALGHVEFRGHGSMEEGAPQVELKLDCSFGEIMVIFE
jgi:predicted membrane protein